MFPIEWMNILPVEELQPGDFAYLLDEEHAAVLVGSIDNHVMLTFLDDPIAGPVNVQNFDGDALVIRGWQVDVDHTRIAKFDFMAEMRIGSLSVHGGKLAITCSRGAGRGYIKLALQNVDLPEAPAKYAFPIWRMFKKNGDEEVTLYKQTGLMTEPSR